MPASPKLLHAYALICVMATMPTSATVVTLTNDTSLSFDDLSLEGAGLVITNCTVTIDGPHTFESIHVQNGGELTHTYSQTGWLPAMRPVVDEMHTLNPTSAPLNNTKVIFESVLVKDLAGTTAYVYGKDYQVANRVTGETEVFLLAGSAIPDGATIRVSYSVQLPAVSSGLYLSVTSTVEVAKGGRIGGNGRGYGPGHYSGTGFSRGTNKPISYAAGSGAGHAGYGANCSLGAIGGRCYGSWSTPDTKGSCGGAGSGPGGYGGGLVKLEVGGDLLVEGEIVCNGANATNACAGGGSGGSIWLTARTLTGVGRIHANGGTGASNEGGGGGGGRIAIQCATNLFAGEVSATGGGGWASGGAGTIYVATQGGQETLLMDNGGLKGTNTPVVVSAGLNLVVKGEAIVQADSIPSLRSLFVGSNSWLQATGVVSIASNAVIEVGGGIDGIGRGYRVNEGTGRGAVGYRNCGGGGHGGRGGMGTTALGGTTHDSVIQPAQGGSGGGCITGYAPVGAGGGAIRLDIHGELVVDGSILMDGGSGMVGSRTNGGSGGGAGGSIWLTAGKFSGAGRLSVRGGTGDSSLGGGGGGGGRIAIYTATNAFLGRVQAEGGAGATYGGAGTIYLHAPYGAVPQLIIVNAGVAGTNTPLPASLMNYWRLKVADGAIATLPEMTTLDSLEIGSNGWIAAPTNPLTLRLYIEHGATISQGGGITVDGMGEVRGRGYGAGETVNNYGGGGGYGGSGGNAATNASGGRAYGSMTSPKEPGSGGGYSNSVTALPNAGSGGGALVITVKEGFVVDGLLSANGISGVAARDGGGSGGCIDITADTLSGGGTLRANGGDGGSAGGGGGGGHLAVSYRTNRFAGSFQALGGSGANSGGAGTIYAKDRSTSFTELLADNGGRQGTNTLFNLSNDPFLRLTVQNGASLSPNTCQELSLRSLYIGSNATVHLGALSPTGCGYKFQISGDALIEAGGKLRSVLSPSAGAGFGPGRSTSSGGGGGGHGGYGSDALGAVNSGGTVYGAVAYPNMVGSSGGTSTPGPGAGGGGAVQLLVQGLLTLDGVVSCDGAPGTVTNSGGGSGGSIVIDAAQLVGAGVISADGGDGQYPNGGGGGGGRVAVYYGASDFKGTIAARGGYGPVYGGAGTVFMRGADEQVGRLIVNNGGQRSVLTGIRQEAPYHCLVTGSAVASLMVWGSEFIFETLQVEAGSGLTQLSPGDPISISVLRDAWIAEGGSISADSKAVDFLGTVVGTGKAGGGTGSGGGGYGGAGGSGAGGALGGQAFGDSLMPFEGGGSGGMDAHRRGSSEGGGVVRMKVGGTLTLDGLVSANGNDGVWAGDGGGAGGSVWLTARELRGSGAISANGGAGNPPLAGGGSGGRVAIYAQTNSFGQSADRITAAGGTGANPGEPGTIYLSSNFPAPMVVKQGAVESKRPVSFVELTYSMLLSAASLPQTEASLFTPIETLKPVLNLVTTNPQMLRVSFPLQNTPGEYTFVLGPQIQDIFGVPVSMWYTGKFTLEHPLISGVVTDPAGLPASGVNLQPSGLPNSTTTDAAGAFTLPVIPGWSGSVTPSLAGKYFIPPAIIFKDVTVDRPNQRFLLVGPELVKLNASTTYSGNFKITWLGTSNVTYQPVYSTNLVNWMDYGAWIIGTGAPMSFIFPMYSTPTAFISVKPTVR